MSIQLPRADTVDIHSARRRQIQSGHQLHDRCLTRAVHTDKRKLLPGLQTKTDIMQCFLLCAAVPIADMVKHNPDIRPCRTIRHIIRCVLLLQGKITAQFIDHVTIMSDSDQASADHADPVGKSGDQPQIKDKLRNSHTMGKLQDQI